MPALRYATRSRIGNSERRAARVTAAQHRRSAQPAEATPSSSIRHAGGVRDPSATKPASRAPRIDAVEQARGDPPVQAADSGLVLPHRLAVGAVGERVAQAARRDRLLARREAEGDQRVVHRRRRAARARLGRELAPDVPAGALDRRQVARRPRGAREPAAQLEVRLGRPPRGLGVLRDRPLVARPAALLARDLPLEQPGVGEAAELDPHGVGVALDARRELLGGRRAPQLAEDAEQPRAKRVGEGGRQRTWRELPCAPLPFSLPTVKNTPAVLTRRGEFTCRRPRGGPCWCPRAGCRRSCWWSCSASSCSGSWPTGPTWPSRRRPQRVVDPPGRSLYTGRGHPQGPAGLPPQRADGVRLGLRPRRVPRARTTPPTTCAAPRTSSRRATAAPAPTARRAGRSRSSAPTATTSAPARSRSPRSQAEAYRRLVRALLALLLRPDDRARAARRRDHRPHRAAAADRVLRLDGVGGSTNRPGPQLLVHEQLAARAARRQQADRQRDRLERALADRAARRDRDPVRRLRPLGASSAGTGASRPRCRSARPATSPSRRRSAPARGSSS